MLHHGMNGGWRLKAANLVCCCLLFIALLRCEAQNLVPNPSFEQNTACPVTLGFQGFSKPLHWETWNQSPEYFHACAGSLGGVDTLIGVPQNGVGFQHPLHGEAYLGMFAYGIGGGGVSYREYVGCELLEPLEIGETYDLSFFTNVGGGGYWWTRWACNNMGMLFTMAPHTWIDWTSPAFELRDYAHLHSAAIVSDTANWTFVSGSFVADSAYRYLVIGNFFSNALTDTAHIVPGTSLGAYYFVDGVCVRPSGQSCEFTTGIPEPAREVPFVWPSPTADLVQVRVGAGMRWQVYDAIGKLMEAGLSPTELLVIPVQHWAQGEYVFRLEGANRKHVRFVVMR